MRYLYGAWLGISLAISGIYLVDWHWWLITIPTVILVVVFHREK